MPPKRASSTAPKKLSKKQLEEQQAQIQAAQAAADAARAAREAAELDALEAARRAEEEMIVREEIHAPRHDHSDLRATILRSFGHLYPQQPVPAPVAEASLIPEAKEESSSPPSVHPPSTPIPSGPGALRRKASSSSGKKTPSAHTAANTTSSSSTSSPGTSPRSTARTVPTAGRGSRRATKEGGIQLKKNSAAEQAAKEAEEAAAAEAARLEEERLKAEADASRPNFSPPTESALSSLHHSLTHHKELTAQTEAAIVAYHAEQRRGDEAEAERLVKDFRLMPGIDMPDEQRRMKEKSMQQALLETPFTAPSPPSPSPSSPSSSPAPRPHSATPGRQVLSASGLVDLQSILDRQRARQAAINRPIKYRDPPRAGEGAAGQAKGHRRRPSRKAELETGLSGRRGSQVGQEEEDMQWDEVTGSFRSSSPAAPTAAARTHSSRSGASTSSFAHRSALITQLMPHSQIQANQTILAKMHTLQNFRRNPRFDERHGRSGGPGGKGLMSYARKEQESKEEVVSLPGDLDSILARPSDMHTLLTALSSDPAAKSSSVESTPSIAWFTEEYQPGVEYHQEIEVKNVATLARRIRVEPPKPVYVEGRIQPQYFHVGFPRYMGSNPSSSSALLAPGMSCFIPIRFTPDALVDYSSLFHVVTETGRITIPLYAVRPKALLDLPSQLEVGTCTREDSLTRSWTVRNIGRATSKFWLMSREQFEEAENEGAVAERAVYSPRHRPILPDPFQGPSSFSLDAPPLFTSKAMIQHLRERSREDQGGDGGGGFEELELEVEGGGSFEIAPASFQLEPGQSIDLLLEYHPHAPRPPGATASPSLSPSVASLHCPFLLVSDETRVSAHVISGKSSELHVEVVEVDGVNLEEKHRNIREQKRVAQVRGERGRRNQEGQMDPPVPLLPEVDSLGPLSPKDEARRRRQLPTTLTLPPPLPHHPSQFVSLAHLPGLLTTSPDPSSPSSSSIGALIRSFDHLVFPNVEVASTTTKTVTLRNGTPLPVQFYWKKQKLPHPFPQAGEEEQEQQAESEEDATDGFSISPSFGSLAPHSSLTFTFTFHPTQTVAYQSLATFVVENVPESNAAYSGMDEDGGDGTVEQVTRDLEQVLDLDADESDPSSPSPSSSLFPTTLTRARQSRVSLVDVEYLSFRLQGVGVGVPFSLDPAPLIRMDAPKQLDGAPVQATITLTNLSRVEGAPARPYKFDTPRITCRRKRGVSDARLEADFDPHAAPITDVQLTPLQGHLGSGESVTLSFSCLPRLLGEYEVLLEVHVPDLLPQSRPGVREGSALTKVLTTRISFCTEGPRVTATCIPAPMEMVSSASPYPALTASSASASTASPGIMDFGLLNLGLPGVHATRQLLLRNESSTAKAWWSMHEAGQAALPFLNKGGGEVSDQDELPVDGGVLTFTPPRGVLDPLHTQLVSVTFHPRSTTPLRSHLVLHTLYSTHRTPTFIQVQAQVQAPVLALTPSVVLFDMRAYRQVNDEEEAAKKEAEEKARKEAEEKARREEEEREAARKKAREEAAAAEAAAMVAAAAAAAAEARAKAEAEAAAKTRKKGGSANRRQKEKEKVAADAAAAAAEAAALAAEALAAAEQSARLFQELLLPTSSGGQAEVLSISSRPPSPLSPPTPEPEPEPTPWILHRPLSTVCVRVPRTFEVTLKNLTNLPAEFKWSVAGNGSSVPMRILSEQEEEEGEEGDQPPPYEVRFSPSSGSLSGRSECSVSITLVCYESGPLHLLLACDIEGVSQPLGVEVKALVKDLTLSYHMLEVEQAKKMEEEVAGQGLKMPKRASLAGFKHARHGSWGSMASSAPGGVLSASFDHSSSYGDVSVAGSIGGASSRTHHTDYSTDDMREQLEDRVAILDKWIPATQVHSKITLMGDKEAVGQTPDDEKESDTSLPLSPSTPTPHCIVPTASALPHLDFGVLPPGSRKSLVLVLRNHTIIPARFRAKVMKLAPNKLQEEEEEEKEEEKSGQGIKKRSAAGSALSAAKQLSEANAQSASTSSIKSALSTSPPQRHRRTGSSLSTSSALSTRSRTSTIGGINKHHASARKKGVSFTATSATSKPIRLTSESEQRLAFQSAKGQEVLAQQSTLQQDQSLIPLHQGVAFLMSPSSSGQLGAYATFCLEVTVVTDQCGLFTDELLVHTRGLGSVRIPLRVEVSGSPLSISHKSLGVVFPGNPRIKLEEAQARILKPVWEVKEQEEGEDEAEEKEPNTAQREQSIVARQLASLSSGHATHEGVVQSGFDQWPKLVFRPVLIHLSEQDKQQILTQTSMRPISASASRPSSSSSSARAARPSSSLARRLAAHTSADGNQSSQLHTISPDQVRTVILENSGALDLKVVWKQYDLRKIDHAKLVDVSISPSKKKQQQEEKEKEEEQMVEVNVDRYVYPEETESLPPAASPSFSPSSTRPVSRAGPPVPVSPRFPFVLDPPELVIPARGSASFKVIYDPTLLGHLKDRSAEHVAHDVTFLEGTIYVAKQSEEGAGSPTSPQQALSATSSTVSLPPITSARSKKLAQVLDDISAFEAASGATLHEASDSDDEQQSASARGQAQLDATRPLRSSFSSSSTLRSSPSTSSRVSAYFAPRPEPRWEVAPAQLSRHLFRLVLSGRTIVPRLQVDKSKGRLKFVMQAPMPSRAETEAGGATEPTPPASLMATRPSTSTAVSKPSTLSVHAYLPAVSSASPSSATSSSSSSVRAQLTAVKLLPLLNRTETALPFRVTVEPAPLFALQMPSSQAEARGNQKKKAMTGSKTGWLSSLSSSLPPPNHLGWKQAADSDSFVLSPGESLVLPIRFQSPPPPSSPSSSSLWSPTQLRSEVRGQVRVEFANGSVQLIPLVAELLRPALYLSHQRHDFQRVHVSDTVHSAFGGSAAEEYSTSANRKAAKQPVWTVFLSNPSLCDGVWQVEHVPSAATRVSSARMRGLSSSGMHVSMAGSVLRTLSNPEFDPDSDCLDDASVFSFSQTEGVIPAGAGSLPSAAAVLPTGLPTALTLTASPSPPSSYGHHLTFPSLPGSRKVEVVQRVPVQLRVHFRPKVKARYKSVFRFHCSQGADLGQTLDLELRGEGGIEENLPTA